MDVDIVAHRGASGVVGEANTLRSFRRAIDLGCDLIETDIRRTRDGRLVCFHDETTPAGPRRPVNAVVPTGRVGDLTLDELRSASGVEVPTLGDALSLCAESSEGRSHPGRVGLDIELKVPEGRAGRALGYERDVIEAVREVLEPDEFVVTSFEPEVLKALAAAAPDVEAGLLVGAPRPAGSPDASALDGLARLVRACRPRLLALHHAWVCPELFETPGLSGLPVYAWTVNEPGRMRELARLGVRAIITDRPDFAAEVLRRPARVLVSASVRDRARRPDPAGRAAFLSGSDVDGTPVHTRQVRIGRGVVSEAPDWIASLFGSKAKTGVVMDGNTRRAAGSRVVDMLDEATSVELEPLAGWDHLTPHDEFAEAVRERTRSCDALVAVGSGTVNDITRYAADRAGKPYVVVATAASMNGYTSSIAALLVNGLKVTVPCRPPVLVLGDTEVVASAPADMTRSGYADLLSKIMATADWRMSSVVTGEPFTDLPGAVVDDAVGLCVEAAEGIGAGDAEAVETLFSGLVLAGFAMTLAGSSAPASGGEHLISHLWDMLAYRAGPSPGRPGRAAVPTGPGRPGRAAVPTGPGRPGRAAVPTGPGRPGRAAVPTGPGLHGLQVGLGALMTSRLYDLLRREDPAGFEPSVLTEEEVAAAHGELWPVIAGEAARKILTPDGATARLELIRERWDLIWGALEGMLVSQDEMRARLARAGVGVTLSAHGIPAGRARHALLHAADIRARYTVLDLARETGCLPRLADGVLEAVT